MWLLQYILYIFQVKECPHDYMDWLVTMYSLFGNKWAELHRGPTLEGDTLEQRESGDQGSQGIRKVSKLLWHVQFYVVTDL